MVLMMHAPPSARARASRRRWDRGGRGEPPPPLPFERGREMGPFPRDAALSLSLTGLTSSYKFAHPCALVSSFRVHAPRLVGWPMPDPCRVGEAATVRTHCTQPLWH